MNPLKVPNLELVRWNDKEYILPYSHNILPEYFTLRYRGKLTPRRPKGFFNELKRVLLSEGFSNSTEFRNAQTRAAAAGIHLEDTLEDYEAFQSFEKAVLSTHMDFIPLVTDPDILENQITDEAYTRKDIALTFIFKYFNETAIPHTQEEMALADKIEHLAETTVNNILKVAPRRAELQGKIRELERAFDTVSHASAEDYPKDSNITELLATSEKALNTYNREYDELIETTKAQLLEIKQACADLNQEHDRNQNRSYLRSEVRLLEDLTRSDDENT